MDMNLYRQVKDLADMLWPMAKAIDLAQSDKTNLADAYSIFQDLLTEPSL